MKRTMGIAALLLLLVGSCGGDDGGSGNALCKTFFGKLQSCGVYSAGKTCTGDLGTPSDRDLCLANCLTAGSCTELEALFCQNDQTLFDSCNVTCPEQLFTCGDNTEIPLSWQCDGFDDCADASDEAGCPPRPMFTCDNGTMIIAPWECDGDNDCGDNSDEVNCPMFTCTNGELVSANAECDGSPDCADASDEDGCATQTCN